MTTIRTGLGERRFVSAIVPTTPGATYQITLGNDNGPADWRAPDVLTDLGNGTTEIEMLVGPGGLNPVQGGYRVWWRQINSPEAFVTHTHEIVIILTAAGDELDLSPDVVLNDDPRLSDQRVPLDASVTIAKLVATGTPSIASFLRGDGSWASPPAVGGADYTALAAVATGTFIGYFSTYKSMHPDKVGDAEYFCNWVLAQLYTDVWFDTPDAVVLTINRLTANALTGTGIGCHLGNARVSFHAYPGCPMPRFRLANGVAKPLTMFPTLTVSGNTNYTVTYTDAANSANTYSAVIGPNDSTTTITSKINAAFPPGATYAYAVASGTPQLTGATWSGSTAYSTGVYVTNSSKVYKATTGGTSAASGGPTGTGTSITDGTVVWSYVGVPTVGSMSLYSPQDRIWNVTISAGGSTASLATPSTNPMHMLMTSYTGTSGQIFENIIVDGNAANQQYNNQGFRWAGYTVFDSCLFYLPHGDDSSPPGETAALRGFKPLGGTVKNCKFFGNSFTALALGLSGDNSVGTICTQTLVVEYNWFYGVGSVSHATANNNMGNVYYRGNRSFGFIYAYNSETAVATIIYDDCRGYGCTSVYRFNKDSGGPSSASTSFVTVRNPMGNGTYAWQFDHQCDAPVLVINDAVTYSTQRVKNNTTGTLAVGAEIAVNGGVYTTSNRPPAALLGAGASITDSTLGKPIWSTGSVWKDATGTTV